MRRSLLLLSAGLTVLSTGLASAQNNTPRNLILFIPDGLRALKVNPETAPAMAEIRDKGVNFKNSHSLFPTFTCLLYTSPSPRDGLLSRMPSSA